jgi:hypothetical protein
MTFFRFDQNNAGGFYIEPARFLFVEADNLEEAERLAVDHGVYFDGVRQGIDCECCGDRWYGVSDECETPHIWGRPVGEYEDVLKDEGIPTYKIIRKS